MKLLKAYKYRIYPNKNQEEILNKHFGCVRFVYNHMLDKKIKRYKTEKKPLYRNEMQVILKKMKRTEEFEWLNEVNSQSLQSAIRNLSIAFTKFFREKKGFPKFKSKKSNYYSFQCPQNVKIDFDNNKITLPKIPSVKIKLHRKFKGKIKTVTISRTPTNKYHASVLAEVNGKEVKKPKIEDITTIGIDMGLTHFATLSTDEKINNPKHLKKSLKKLRIMQKRLSKKQKGSNNRNKERLKVAKLHEKIHNQRIDFIHKLTYKLICDSQANTFVLENLNIGSMLKNHYLAQAICDVGWGVFNFQMKYKSRWYNKNLLRIGMFEPSSKICSICGETNHELTLAIREWICTNCGSKHDRDENAAINIKKFGLQDQNLIAGVERTSIMPVELSTLVGAEKQEALF